MLYLYLLSGHLRDVIPPSPSSSRVEPAGAEGAGGGVSALTIALIVVVAVLGVALAGLCITALRRRGRPRR